VGTAGGGELIVCLRDYSTLHVEQRLDSGLPMHRAAGEGDTAAADFNEEEHTQSPEPYRVDSEEVHRDDAFGLRRP
jgi:hypothetical protein